MDIEPRQWFVGDTGTIKMVGGFDITGYTASTDLTFRIIKPDDTRAALTTNPTIITAGIAEVSVDFVAGDLDQEGEYLIQFIAAKTSNPTRASDVEVFHVDGVIPAP